MFKRFFSIAFVCCFVFTGSSLLIGQETGLESVLGAGDFVSEDVHDFMDVDGELLVTGKFMSLERSTVKILEFNGNRTEIKINRFSDEDQAYIRQLANQQRKYERDKKETREILVSFQRTDDIAKLVTACNKLRGFGPAAKMAEGAMRGFFTHEDERVKRAAFRAFAAICDVTEVNYRLLIDEMENERWGMRDAFINYPDDYLESLLRFREYCLAYIQHAAYTGRLKLKSGEPSLAEEPELFTEARSSKNKVRAAACKTFGIWKDPAGTNVLLDLLPVAEKPVSEKRDDKTIEAIIKSLGEIGINNDEVIEALTRHKTDFPDEVAKAFSLLKKDE